MTTTLDFTDAYGEFSNYSEDGFTVTAIGGSGHFLIDGGLYEGLYDIRASEPGAEFSAISASVGGSPEGIPFTVQFTAIYANGSSFTKTFNAPGGGTLTFGPEFSDIVALASGFVEWVRPDTGALISVGRASDADDRLPSVDDWPRRRTRTGRKLLPDRLRQRTCRGSLGAYHQAA